MANNLPWSGLKIAFDFKSDPDELFDRLGSDEFPLPDGWELKETDGCGARYVAIFDLTDVLLRVEDAEAVKKMIETIDAGN